MLGIDLIQGIAQLAVLGNRLYLKYPAQVAGLAGFFQSLLKLQQGRVLKKHHGKPGHQAIMEPKPGFALLAPIVNGTKVFAERLT